MTNNAGILGVRTWRLQKGISLESIAQSTKLGMRQLEAIELGEFSKLPGGVYNTSYIRQYARAIGFDEEDLLEFYRDTVKPETTEPQKQRRRPLPILGELFQP